jgi:hypothetical protein
MTPGSAVAAASKDVAKQKKKRGTQVLRFFKLAP